MAKATKARIGNLDCLRVDGKPDGNTIVLLHGFGANCNDLLFLHENLKAPSGTTWIFPNGFLDLGYSSSAWFPLMASNLPEGINLSNIQDFSKIKPAGIDKAREELDNFFKDLKIPTNKITLGGFSQGAMLSLDYLLNTKKNFAGLVLMSGTLIKEPEWKELAPLKSGFQFFQSHGTNDPLLPFSAAKKLEALLRESNWVGEFVAFEGDHEIPPPVQKRLSNYLNR